MSILINFEVSESGKEHCEFKKNINQNKKSQYMKRLIISLMTIAVMASSTVLRADEGMWLLPLLEKFNGKTIAEMGCKLTPEQIYSINNTSLKDAIVQFGGGCTGEIISDEGLLVTNHHCGYASIQALSSVEHDYLTNGFWAMSREQELPAKGLSVTFVVKFVDVTAEFDAIANSGKSDKAKSKADQKLRDKYTKAEKKADPYVDCSFVSFYGGNQKFLIVTKTYKDVRLVGTPPSSIGKFGGDTDNWMWPRHTGDFSMFRVYADANNNPAEYSESNVPYKAKNHLKISLKGVEENDYTMIIGFPGRTNRYMTASELVERRDIDNAIRIEVRGVRQDVLMKDMLADQKIYIQYASKYAMSSNYWKNSIGMNETFFKLDVEGRRHETDMEFEKWANENPERAARYGNVVKTVDRVIADRRDARREGLYASEALGQIELFKLSGSAGNSTLEGFSVMLPKMESFYKDFSASTDRKVAKALLLLFRERVASASETELYKYISDNYGGDIDRFVDDVYDNTVFTDLETLEAAVNGLSEEQFSDLMAKDKGVIAGKMLVDALSNYRKGMSAGSEELAAAKKLYIAGLLEMKGDQPIYPDANSTMRMTYGKVLSYSPKDAVIYDYITTLDGVMQKEKPGDHEFTVPERLKELYRNKDFGQYAMEDGRMPVAFLSNNDITGGNSGSPIMNANGELIGLAFDGNWEAMSGDIIFEPQLQRCINVDIRYVLFIVEKYGNAKHLVDEMTIVK